MNKSKTVAAAVLAISLAACGGDGDDNTSVPADPTTPTLPTPEIPVTPAPTPETPAPGEPTPETPDPVAEVYIDESFEGLSALPAGWTTLAANKGTVSVRNGSLYIDGRAHSTQMTAVALPASLQELGNYRIDVQFTLESPNNTGRWGSVMYRTSSADSAIPHEPYYQFAIRADATASNGTEFALRKGGAWTVAGTKAYSEAIDPAKVYTATVIVHGNRVRQYLDNTLMHDMALDAAMAKGGIGLQTAGAIMRVDSIKVTQQLTALPDVSKVITVQDTGTLAAMAPTLVQSMTAQTRLAGSGASNALFHIDATLNLRSANGESLGSLAQYLAPADRATIPVLRIADDATVRALAAFAVDNDLSDVTLLSGDIELLARARTAIPAVRTAVDFSGSAFLGNTSQDILQVVSATNRAKAKIAVLPATMTNRTTVAHLQRLLITPWASSTATNAAAAAEVLTTGVNGVVTAHADIYSAVLKKLPAGTLLRKPLVIGHRGMPGDRANLTGQFADENTLEGARAAAAVGADGIENDIYMTVDNHLVIMHDTTVERTTDGGPRKIEEMTLAEVKALKTRPGGYSVPTLQEFFTEFKGRNLSHIVELKSASAGIVPLLKQELEQAGVKDQVVTISFLGDQLKRMGTTLPDISGGFLNSNLDNGDVGAGVRTILNSTQLYSSTYNPAYQVLKQPTMEAAKHRGITFWPWTVNNANDFYRFYSYGTHGITTDHAYLAKDFPVAIATAATASATAGSPFSAALTLTTQVGATSTAASNQLVVLDGSPAHSVAADGRVTFTATGTATVLPGYSYRMGDGTYSYTIFGKPMTVTVR
ncbi:glycerophosphodiester phosphodiesterase family protein [Comamonas endophytica]|uniref:Glycerophosphodiester phosphodiesterase family protein n=1 Tax=Comamonas endophytica TaxID=2949090 RepID=A0ABY6G5D3_9BURK|nr:MULTISPECIES: glycerophosphodiester phosphodiesterase family protein [unclassified Acidovorax]UYG50204.1 glycerophosphodiester phosphodiesterase family protein [Acidovorax sp. 5MLIR]